VTEFIIAQSLHNNTCAAVGGANYDGDGDTSEGIKGEIDTLLAAVYAALQDAASATGAPIVYYSQSILTS